MNLLTFVFRAAPACLSLAVAGASTGQIDLEKSSVDILVPYDGPVTREAPIETLHGTVMAGYQGWFLAEGDGMGEGFVHWGNVDKDPARTSVDMWPDMSELDADERFPTNFRYPDGTRAEVFSSIHPKTVDRHFEWMKEYGIDGVFVQRFTAHIDPSNPTRPDEIRTNTVLANARAGANAHGRGFAVMYDTDLDARRCELIQADWDRLYHKMEVTRSPSYIRHDGGPVVTLWGYGFEHRQFDPVAVRKLLEFLTAPENGGATIMLGLPNAWASWTDEKIELIKEFCTIPSPWQVGRYADADQARGFFADRFPTDIAFCEANGMDFYPVIFPGFSWTNLSDGRDPLNQIPRREGRFLWDQAELVKEYGLDMVYVAMFDEVDEGTTIMKVTNQPPVGRFATYEGLPSDAYLTLTGLIGGMMRGENPAFPTFEKGPAADAYVPQSQLAFYAKESPFPAEVTETWSELLDGVPVVMHEETFSPWIADLYNSKALDLRLSSWEQILAKGGFGSPLAVFGRGDERIADPGVDADAVAAAMGKHLADGNVLLMMSGGRYPAYHPGQGAIGENFGFRLNIQELPDDAVVRFSGRLRGLPARWTPERRVGARLMRAADYPDAAAYESLAAVRGPGGEDLGDLIAAVKPGGDFGDGTLIYVGSTLLEHPDRAAVLSEVLGLASRAAGR